jgi:hypothetical protein
LSGDPPTGPTPPAQPYYFNLGDIRLINNRWGSDKLGTCSPATQQQVCINSDGSLGWSFNRGNCGDTGHADPDFPEVEFGVAPFGNQSPLLTSPAYSSTTLLPIQISNLNSATLSLSSFSTTLSDPTFWDSNFEFWISEEDPTKNANAGVYAEVIVFLGWEANRQGTTNGGWQCMVSGTVPNTNFNLCHQSDAWSTGPQWRFFNFVAGNGPLTSFSGTVDIKAILDWIMQNYAKSTNSALPSFSSSMWRTRIEVGTEINDSTAGSAKINNVSFAINGTTKSLQFGN